MVGIIGQRDSYVDDEGADSSMLTDAHPMAGKNATLRELGIANLERQYAFLRRMQSDWNPWGEERKLAETRRLVETREANAVRYIEERRQRTRDRIWAGFVLRKRQQIEPNVDTNMVGALSPEVVYADWNVKKPGLKYTGGTKVKDGTTAEDDEDDSSLLSDNVPSTGLVHKIIPGRSRGHRRIKSRETNAATLRKVDQTLRSLK